MHDRTVVDIRPVGGEEAGIYLALRREMLLDTPHAFLSSPADDHANDPESLRRRLSGPSNVIVGAWRTQGHELAPGPRPSLVGVAGVYREPREKILHRASIWGVYVTPSARGLGIGRLLMSHAIDTAKAWPGVRRIGLCVSERSANAIRLYESLGFLAWGKEPDAMLVDGVRIDEIHMSLDCLGSLSRNEA